MSLISIRNIRAVNSRPNSSNGSTVTTVAKATLAVAKSLIKDEHFAVNVSSLLAETDTHFLVPVFAKEREAQGQVLDRWIEYPTSRKSDGNRQDVCLPITAEMRRVSTQLVWKHINANGIRNECAKRSATDRAAWVRALRASAAAFRPA